MHGILLLSFESSSLSPMIGLEFWFFIYRVWVMGDGLVRAGWFKTTILSWLRWKAHAFSLDKNLAQSCGHWAVHNALTNRVILDLGKFLTDPNPRSGVERTSESGGDKLHQNSPTPSNLISILLCYPQISGILKKDTYLAFALGAIFLDKIEE